MTRTVIDLETGETHVLAVTQDEIDAEAAIREAEEAARSYAEKRRREYPPVEDYLDAIVKGDQAQLAAYIEACLAVKARHPKPGAR